jgi:hypothetical protein
MSTRGGAAYAKIMRRELGRLGDQIRAYPDEAGLWRVGGQTKNSGATLALHLVGNLQHFVAATLGASGYVRDRDAEFNERDVPREQILARIESCKRAVPDVLEGLSDDDLAAPYPGELPQPFRGYTTEEFLLHLLWHLGWHMGQIDYHRRIVAGDGG